jgi:hypothetical protein
MQFSQGKPDRHGEARDALLEMRRAIVKPKIVAMVTDEHGKQWILTETPFSQRLVWFLYVTSLWATSTMLWIVIPGFLIYHSLKWLFSW